MDINEIKRITKLLMKVNCTNYALISEVAKEMSVKKTALMQFIEDNPKLFKVREIHKAVNKRSTNVVGLGISSVYLTPGENPDTEEFIDIKRKEWEKKIHVCPQSYYGVIEFWYIPEDTKGNESKLYLYRNTTEKLKELEGLGIIKKGKHSYGGLGDYHELECYIYNNEVEKKLKEAGWRSDFNGEDE